MQDTLDVFKEDFDRRGIELIVPPIEGQHLSEDELIELIADVEGIIAGDDPFTARVLAHAPRLRVLAKWGIGIDGIDLAEAERRGVQVINTPGVFGDDVADVAGGYLVMLARQLQRVHESVSAGGWLKPRGQALAGATLGIAGFGNIGRAVAQRGRGFGMEVITYDVAEIARRAATEANVSFVNLEELFGRSDFLVLCMPLTAETHHIVNGRTLARMPKGSFLVNVARGPLVDEAALVEALRTGQLAAAALDVFETEPLPPDSELRAFPQCVFGSHNSSNTEQSVIRASAQAARNVLVGLGYEPPR
jgi:D-3-phosphoglycerate dehydrogenase